ncbi:MAG: response regulator [Halobacteriovoraceae bacterium]|jgi:two-component system, chemotaxis family, chemotaxis protein CheY|nr:response regulator [Halobacteriovoraceae bacterium]MBT5094203.1 response regulator [Halobacteriovoraceae bacterium]
MDILVVDDEIEICQFIQNFLEKSGKFDSVVEAHDGTEAINKLLNQHFDMVILDIIMPKRGGIEVVKAIKNNAKLKNLPIIIISGNFQGDVVKEAMQLGVKHMLAKPFKNVDLMSKLEEIIDDLQSIKMAS